MSEEPKTPYIEQISKKISGIVLPHYLDVDRKDALFIYLMRFADEIKRSAIEP